jgi:hypothetical protein
LQKEYLKDFEIIYNTKYGEYSTEEKLRLIQNEWPTTKAMLSFGCHQWEKIIYTANPGKSKNES